MYHYIISMFHIISTVLYFSAVLMIHKFASAQSEIPFKECSITELECGSNECKCINGRPLLNAKGNCECQCFLGYKGLSCENPSKCENVKCNSVNGGIVRADCTCHCSLGRYSGPSCETESCPSRQYSSCSGIVIQCRTNQTAKLLCPTSCGPCKYSEKPSCSEDTECQRSTYGCEYRGKQAPPEMCRTLGIRGKDIPGKCFVSNSTFENCKRCGTSLDFTTNNNLVNCPVMCGICSEQPCEEPCDKTTTTPNSTTSTKTEPVLVPKVTTADISTPTVNVTSTHISTQTIIVTSADISKSTRYFKTTVNVTSPAQQPPAKPPNKLSTGDSNERTNPASNISSTPSSINLIRRSRPANIVSGSSQAPPDSNSSGTMIASIVLGVLLFFAISAGGIVIILRYKRKRAKGRQTGTNRNTSYESTGIDSDRYQVPVITPAYEEIVLETTVPFNDTNNISYANNVTTTGEANTVQDIPRDRSVDRNYETIRENTNDIPERNYEQFHDYENNQSESKYETLKLKGDFSEPNNIDNSKRLTDGYYQNIDSTKAELVGNNGNGKLSHHNVLGPQVSSDYIEIGDIDGKSTSHHKVLGPQVSSDYIEMGGPNGKSTSHHYINDPRVSTDYVGMGDDEPVYMNKTHGGENGELSNHIYENQQKT